MIGKIFEHAGIVLAALVTLCTFLLLFLPWSTIIPPAPAKTVAAPGVVYVQMSLGKPAAKDRGTDARPHP
jgi:uncharacterized membrane protein YozB (DUF420 family)